MIRAVFFDLDGTLLPMDENEFIGVYFKELCKKAYGFGYEDSKKLSEVIWNGVKEMMINDGSKINEDAFWDYFVKVYGEDKIKDKPNFNSFYANEFKKSIVVTKPNPLAKEIVEFCKKNFEHVVLATNPLFPKVGTLTRMNFIGLKEEDFSLITTYEDTHYCKPNPKYFLEIMERLNLKPEEIIMFGNNDYEDGDCSKKAGFPCYLIEGYIINNPKAQGKYPVITMNQVIPTLQRILEKDRR